MQYRHRLFVALTFIMSFATGSTMALDSYDAAEQLANVLASEQICNLTFDQDAIEAWIEANVAADDMEFSGNLTGSMSLSEYMLDEMPPSAQTAHCAQVRRVSKSFGFTK